MGTTVGVVAIFDSETVNLLNCFHWHKDKVRMLLAMPRQVEPCICAEIPFPEQQSGSSCNSGTCSRASRASSQGLADEPLQQQQQQSRARVSSTTKKQQQQQQQQQQLLQARNFNSQFSYLENKYCIHNTDPQGAMIVSVGNGKVEYSVPTATVATAAESKEERVKAFDRAAMKKSVYKASNKHQYEDVVLLSWRT